MALYGEGLYGSGTYGIVLRLSFRPERNELYIEKDSTLTYILSKFGLSAISAGINSITHYLSTILVHSPNVISQDNITFSTDIINFGTQGLKALEWINLEADIADDVFVTVRYRDSIKDAFVAAPQKQFNNEGVCHIGVRGVDFILDFSIPAYTNVHLNMLDVSVQFVDRRFRRGTNIENTRR